MAFLDEVDSIVVAAYDDFKSYNSLFNLILADFIFASSS